MKRIRPWLTGNLITILAGVAGLLVILTTVLGSMNPNPFPIEPEGRPWLYDLSLAIIAGYIFNLLVVELPGRRKQKAFLGALQGHLMLVANNGHDLIRDLELIGECPKFRVTPEHVRAVLTSLNDTPAVNAFIAKRLQIEEEAYERILPYAANLPSSLLLALQDVNRLHIHKAFRQHYDPEAKQPLRELRQESNEVKEFIAMRLGAVAYRRTLAHLERLFTDYYFATEAVRTEVKRHLPKGVSKSPLVPPTQRVFLLWRLGKVRQNDYFEYPKTAHSERPLSVLKGETYQTDTRAQEEEPALPSASTSSTQAPLIQSLPKLPTPLLRLLTFLQPLTQRLADTLPKPTAQRDFVPKGDTRQE